MQNVITVSGTITDRATLTTITATYKEYKETLIDFIDDLTRHSYIVKCQAQNLKMTKEIVGENETVVIAGLILDNKTSVSYNENRVRKSSKSAQLWILPLIFQI